MARAYDGTQRAEAAATRRQQVLDAAGRVFERRGYAGATIQLIAEEAGVAVETVYRSAAGKRGLLAAAIRASAAGGVDRAAVPVDERRGIRRVIDEPDPHIRLTLYLRTVVGTWRRMGPLQRVLDAAGVDDADLEALRVELEADRLNGMRRFAQSLFDQHALRADVSVDRAADLLWAHCGRAVFVAFVTDRGWSEGDYIQHLSGVLAHALLTAPPAP